jgi:hypothetical protein
MGNRISLGNGSGLDWGVALKNEGAREVGMGVPTSGSTGSGVWTRLSDLVFGW